MENVAIPEQTPEASALEKIRKISMNMNGWLKFLGIVNIISGAFTAMSVVGIIVAWLPIWLGILLLQAGNQASSSYAGNDPKELVRMMEKLRLYFIIQGILFIVAIAFVVLGFVFFGAMMSRFYEVFPE